MRDLRDMTGDFFLTTSASEYLSNEADGERVRRQVSCSATISSMNRERERERQRRKLFRADYRSINDRNQHGTKASPF
jgi:hypothetical protein